MADVYDVDAVASEFSPLRIKFRGEEYLLGQGILGLMQASGIFEGIEDGTKAMEKLPAILRALCPEFPEDAELGTGEAFALMAAATEVLNRVATFRAGASAAEE